MKKILVTLVSFLSIRASAEGFIVEGDSGQEFIVELSDPGKSKEEKFLELAEILKNVGLSIYSIEEAATWTEPKAGSSALELNKDQ